MSFCQRCGAPIFDPSQESSESKGNSGNEKEVQFADIDAPFNGILVLDLNPNGLEDDASCVEEPGIMQAPDVLFEALGLFLRTADSRTQAWAVVRLSLPCDKSLAN